MNLDIPIWEGLKHIDRFKYNPAGNNYKWWIEEKVDGSSLAILNGKIDYRGYSVGHLHPILNLGLNPAYKYFGESFRSAYHNYVQYKRPPRHYFVCYDIFDVIKGQWLTREELEKECELRGLEASRVLYTNTSPGTDPYQIMNDLMNKLENGEIDSMLGGKPEGLVLKHTSYEISGVSTYCGIKKERADLAEAVNSGKLHAVFENLNIDTNEFISRIGKLFATSARRRKAIQHLSERGLATDEWSIIQELNKDFDREYKEEIKEYLWRELGPIIRLNAIPPI